MLAPWGVGSTKLEDAHLVIHSSRWSQVYLILARESVCGWLNYISDLISCAECYEVVLNAAMSNHKMSSIFGPGQAEV